jgi:DNA polymerase III epsilon subunit-like protein
MFLVCDLETTSANVNNAQIITGTFLAVDKDFKLLAEKRIKCKPWKWDSEADQASNIHGITKDMVINWPSFFEILPDLFQWLEIYDLKHFVCHSKRDMFGKKTTFDHAVIRLNLFPSDYYWKFVNMFNERNIISTHSLALYLDNIYNFTKKDLKSISTALGIALDNHHDDRQDAIACYEILKKLFPKINLTDFINKDYYHIGVLNERRKKSDSILA